MEKQARYFFSGVFFWLLVEWTTVFQPDFTRWLTYWPGIWVFYLGFPLIFSFLIYRWGWSERKIFIAAIVTAFISEIVLFHNPLLYTFPVLLLAIPAAIAIYCFIVFVPKWIVDQEIRNNRIPLVVMTVVWVLISVATFAGNTR